MATPEEVHATLEEFIKNPGEYAEVLEDEIEGFKYVVALFADLTEGAMEHEIRAVAIAQLLFERHFWRSVYEKREHLLEKRQRVVIKQD